jgi:Zn-dependent protease with chaperone function
LNDPAERPFRRWFAATAVTAIVLALAAGPLPRAHAAPEPGARGTVPVLIRPTDVGSDSGGRRADSLAILPPPAPRDSMLPAVDYLAKVRADFTPENRSYSRLKTVLEFVSPLYSVLIGLLILFSGLASGIRDVAHALGHRRYVRVLVFLTLYAIVVFVFTLPLTWYDEFALEHQFGLSTQGFGGWFADQLKAGVFTLVMFGVLPILWLVYRVFEKSPRHWWAWLAAGVIPLVVASVLLQPLVFDPMFNKFTPLRDEHLKTRILALAARADIPARRVYEVNKSAQTKKYNAYVNGFGASQRIVLWDTTLHGMKEDEILFVMGHEMGHYKLHHIWQGIGVSAVLALVLLWVAARLCDAALKRYGLRWGVYGMADVASLPLLMLVFDLLTFAAQPVINGYSRRVEHEADVFGLEITRDNDAAARAFVKLGSQNKSNPDPSPVVEWMLYTHPSESERVSFAMHYRPWAEGKPDRFYRPRP